MEPSELLRILWRRRLWLALGAALGLAAVLTVGSTSDAEPEVVYDGEALLLVRAEEAPAVVTRLAYVAGQSSVVADRTAAALGDMTSEAVQEAVEVEADRQLGSITLEVRGAPDEPTLTRLLGEFGTQLEAQALEERVADRDAEIALLDEQRISLEARIAVLEASLAEARTAALPPGVEPDSPEAAAIPFAPDPVVQAQLSNALLGLESTLRRLADLSFLPADDLAPLESVGISVLPVEVGTTLPIDRTGQLLIGGLLGLVFASALAVALHRYDTTIYRKSEAETAFGTHVLATIPVIGRRYRRRPLIIAEHESNSGVSEAYRSLRSTMAALFRRGEPGDDGELRVILVGSPGEQSGKSTTVANLAVAFAQAGQSVLVVGADLRLPIIHEFFSAVPEPGLSDARSDGGPAALDGLIQATRFDRVDILTHGAPVDDPGECLAACRDAIELAARQYDIVLIDSPPMFVGSDFAELAPVATDILLTVRAGYTRAEDGQRAAEVVERLRLPLIGIILVGAADEVAVSRSYDYRARRGLLSRFAGYRHLDEDGPAPARDVLFRASEHPEPSPSSSPNRVEEKPEPQAGSKSESAVEPDAEAEPEPEMEAESETDLDEDETEPEAVPEPEVEADIEAESGAEEAPANRAGPARVTRRRKSRVRRITKVSSGDRDAAVVTREVGRSSSPSSTSVDETEDDASGEVRRVSTSETGRLWRVSVED